MEHSSNTNPRWFTQEFLEQILRTVENDNTITIISSNVANAAENGATFRISLEIARKSSEPENKSIIMKLVPESTLGDMMSTSTMFLREIKVFSEILPKAHKLLENIIPGVQTEFGAKYYYSEDKIPYMLMVEDLSMSGFSLAKNTVGLDLPHSTLVMKTLGRFHASSVALIADHPRMFDIFSKSLFQDTKSIGDALANLCHNGFKNAINVIEKWENRGQILAQKLTRRSETIMEDFKSCYEINPNEFNVLIHGDLWINNIMFRYDDVTKDLKDLKFVYFQTSSVASPTIDLQYFIHTSIRDDVREHHTEELLKVYHEELSKTLTLLGHEDKTISFENLMKDYEKRAVLSLFWIITTLPIMKGEQNATEAFDGMIEKENDDVTNVTVCKECEHVWKRLIPVFEEKGLL